MKWQINNECFFVESKRYVIRGFVRAISGDLVTVQYGAGKAIRIRSSRLFQTEQEAKASFQKKKNHYDYGA